ncbi:MAG: hypothetical protein P1U86_15605 [Verrucomicrobiales bacterium]|nr:hypothetical protein [Verrucomicrobiales bacterium]
MKIASLFLLLLSLIIPHEGKSEEAAISLDLINDAVAFLAGTELPHQTDHPLTQTNSWATHVKTLDAEFESHRERVLFPMSEWSNTELPSELTLGSTVRYMFSGPDILHAFHMFPSADTFVLCGLEPVGEIPKLSELSTGNAGRALGEVRNALGEIINFSFFRTKDMKDDLQFSTFHGTTPIMMIFLTRSGQYIKGVDFLKLNEDGTLTSKGLDAKGADGVKIEFSPLRFEKRKTLYYFSSDLSDGGFPKSGFKTWLESLPKGNAYLKAASFLMHESYFKEIRNHLLDHSVQIVEDDSGIPFRHFKADLWYADLFGSYTGPIDLFSEHYQSDLRAAYRSRQRPLAFGTGYKWRKGESNLMRFVRQDALAEIEEKAKESPEVKPETGTAPTPETPETSADAASPVEAAEPAAETDPPAKVEPTEPASAL